MRQELKIVFPIGSFYPAQEGGPDNSVYWLNKGLNKKGIKTTVLSTTKGIKKFDIKPGMRITKYDVESIFFNYYGSHFICPNLYVWFFKNIKRYDLVHLTSVFFPMSLIIALIVYSFGVPFAISPRGELDEEALCYGKLKKLFYLKLVRPLFGRARLFHATCENESKQVKKYFGNHVKCIIIPNAIEKLNDSYDKIDVYKKFNIDRANKYILSVGRISPKKALENLIKAFTKINHNNVELIIAGNSENAYGEKLKQLAQEHNLSEKVKFIGHIQGNVKESLYSSAAIFVLPSHTENFGNVVLEALNREVPVIASKGTPWQCLEEYRCGFWVENNPQILAKTINRFFNMDEAQQVSYKQNTQKLLKKRFIMDKICERFIDMWTNSLPPQKTK